METTTIYWDNIGSILGIMEFRESMGGHMGIWGCVGACGVIMENQLENHMGTVII